MPAFPFDPAEALAFAAELADAARPIALRYFRTPLDVDSKADESPVTIADRTIEAEMRRMIEARYPKHGIYGEEFGVRAGNGLTWVLDPIDGTRSFITGLPLFGTLIALASDDRPFVGLIDIPATGERWTGSPLGADFAGRPAATSPRTQLSDARLYATSPELFDGKALGAFQHVAQKALMRRYGGDCYSYGLLASGHCDLVMETGLQPYDFMALVPVIEAAGGVITDWAGGELSIGSAGDVLACSTPALHAEVLAKIREQAGMDHA